MRSSYFTESSTLKNTAGDFCGWAVEWAFNVETGKAGMLSRAERAAILKSAEYACRSGYIGDGDTLYPRIEPDGFGGTEIALYLSDYDRDGLHARDIEARSPYGATLMEPWDHIQRTR